MSELIIPESLTLQKPETTTSQVARLITEAIIRGEFTPGVQLPEIPLAKSLGISRGTVREALREIESLGIIEIKPHRGAFISSPSKKRIQELFSLRAVLESFAARLSAQRASRDKLLGDLNAAIDQQREAEKSGDIIQIVQADLNFHTALSSHCSHRLLLKQLALLEPESRRFIMLVQQHFKDYSEVVNFHLPIVKAVENGDPDEVANAVHQHVTKSGERLLAGLEKTL